MLTRTAIFCRPWISLSLTLGHRHWHVFFSNYLIHTGVNLICTKMRSALVLKPWTSHFSSCSRYMALMCFWCKRKRNYSPWTPLELFVIFSTRMFTKKAEYFSGCCVFEHIIWIIAFIRMQPISGYWFLHRAATLTRGNWLCVKHFLSAAHLKCELNRLWQSWFNHLMFCTITNSASLLPVYHVSLFSYTPVNTKETIKTRWCHCICKGASVIP